ncbi:MAG: ATP-binding protein [Spirulinaceae cyanobacterium]
MWNAVKAGLMDVEFDFSRCRFLRPNAVAFLGGLIRWIQYHQKDVTLRPNTLRPEIRRNLERNHFLTIFNQQSYPWMCNAIPYCESKKQDIGTWINYVRRQWLRDEWIKGNSRLQQYILQQVSEIYLNAFYHSRTPIGLFTCGQYFPNRRELQFAMVDFGHGIPHNVRDYMDDPDLSACEALQWALKHGTSTRLGVPGGIGLYSLKTFVQTNRAKLMVLSDGGCAIVGDCEEMYQDCLPRFSGTVVSITLQCDSSLYLVNSNPVLRVS